MNTDANTHKGRAQSDASDASGVSDAVEYTVKHSRYCCCIDRVCHDIQMAQKCPICGDWLMIDQETVSDDLCFVYHKDCAF